MDSNKGKEELECQEETDANQEEHKEIDVKDLQQQMQEIGPAVIESIIRMRESTKRILEPLQPILQMQENMRSILQPMENAIAATKQIREISSAFRNAFTIPINLYFGETYEVARQIAISISKLVQEINIPSISEERKRELIEIYEIWGSYGWTINPCENVKMIFNSKPIDKKSADAIALKQFTGSKMEQIFEVINRTKRVKRTDFKEAVFDYRHKQYKSCAFILISLVDAILIRLQKKSDLKGKRRKVGLYAVNEAKKRTEMDVNTDLFFTALFYTNLFSCLEKVFEAGKDFKIQPKVINRNFLDHGMMTRKIRRKDCIQLFLLYYNMLELLDLIY